MNRYQLALFLVLAALVNLHCFLQMMETRRGLRLFQAQAHDLAAENQRLKDEIYALENDPFFLEKIAREELGLVKKGEWVIREK